MVENEVSPGGASPVVEEERPISIFDACETDADAAENGRWFSDIWDGLPATVKLRRFTSNKAVATRSKLLNKYRRYLKNNKYPPDIDEKMMIELIAEGVIVDWAKIYDRDGKEIPFSFEVAKVLLKMPDFRIPLVDLAMKMDGFRAEEAEAVKGNS